VYKSLQAGRAIAAILVVLFHLGIAISADKYFGITAFSIPFSFGGAGVNFFSSLAGLLFLPHIEMIFFSHTS
jgi:peptidoglycan/LPS O-acetylase OafA/YrhL